MTFLPSTPCSPAAPLLTKDPNSIPIHNKTIRNKMILTGSAFVLLRRSLEYTVGFLVQTPSLSGEWWAPRRLQGSPRNVGSMMANGNGSKLRQLRLARYDMVVGEHLLVFLSLVFRPSQLRSIVVHCACNEQAQTGRHNITKKIISRGPLAGCCALAAARGEDERKTTLCVAKGIVNY